jgi:alkanesulfonate monooxygenase SsuD/methylene tetrahydromethanopterin reductase-like flavin-dependent oxidoreductase (luciferase family)
LFSLRQSFSADPACAVTPGCRASSRLVDALQRVDWHNVRVPLDIAISVPQLVADHAFDKEAFRRYLVRAEELDFDGAWVAEQVVGTAPVLDPSVMLAYSAAYTERIRLGCAVYVSSLTSPLHLAKTIATLDQVSAGRLDVGLGTGGGFRAFSAFGIDRDGFVSRFVEGLRLMQAAWTEDRVDFEGRFWQASGVAMEPKPYQKPYPPIWFGGSHPDALCRAVRLADGFMGAGSTTTTDFVRQAGIVREELDRLQREPGEFRVAKRVYLAVDEDPEVASSRLSEALRGLYGYFGLTGIERVGVSGRPCDVVAELQTIVDAGADLLVLHPLYDDADQMERLAAEVVPLLNR